MVSRIATLALAAFVAFTGTASAKGEPEAGFTPFEDDLCTTAAESPVSMYGMVGSSGCFGFCKNFNKVVGAIAYNDVSSKNSTITTCYPYPALNCNNTVPHTTVRASLITIDEGTYSANGVCLNTNLKTLVTPESGNYSSIQCFVGDCDGIKPY
jgi:hypothetical protein